MKREFLTELGIEDENVIEKIMSSNGYDLTKAIEKAVQETKNQFKPELEKLKKESAELEKLRKENMTAEELTKQALSAAEAERKNYLKMQGEAKATTILVKAGVGEDVVTKILPILVTDDVSITEKNANEYAEVLTNAVESAKKAKEEELLKSIPLPPAGGGTQGSAQEFQKQLEEAQANGDMASVAYLTRLRQQNQGG